MSALLWFRHNSQKSTLVMKNLGIASLLISMFSLAAQAEPQVCDLQRGDKNQLELNKCVAGDYLYFWGNSVLQTPWSLRVCYLDTIQSSVALSGSGTSAAPQAHITCVYTGKILKLREGMNEEEGKAFRQDLQSSRSR